MSKPIKAFKVKVIVVPPNLEIALGVATIKTKEKTIYGTSLKDAKQKAGIQ